MQWLINEFKAFKEEIKKSIEEVKSEYRDNYIAHVSRWGELERRMDKVDGEIKAMKARAGKKSVGGG